MVDTRCVRTRQKGLRNANQWTVDWAYMIGLGLQGRGLVVGALASCTGCVKHVVRQPQKIKKKKRPRKPWTRYIQKTRMTKKNMDTKTRQRKTWQKSLEQRTPDTHGKTDTQHKRDKNKRSIAGKKTHTHTKGRDSKHWKKKKKPKASLRSPIFAEGCCCAHHTWTCTAHTRTHRKHKTGRQAESGQTQNTATMAYTQGTHANKVPNITKSELALLTVRTLPNDVLVTHERALLQSIRQLRHLTPIENTKQQQQKRGGKRRDRSVWLDGGTTGKR